MWPTAILCKFVQKKVFPVRPKSWKRCQKMHWKDKMPALKIILCFVNTTPTDNSKQINLPQMSPSSTLISRVGLLRQCGLTEPLKHGVLFKKINCIGDVGS